MKRVFNCWTANTLNPCRRDFSDTFFFLISIQTGLLSKMWRYKLAPADFPKTDRCQAQTPLIAWLDFALGSRKVLIMHVQCLPFFLFCLPSSREKVVPKGMQWLFPHPDFSAPTGPVCTDEIPFPASLGDWDHSVQRGWGAAHSAWAAQVKMAPSTGRHSQIAVAGTVVISFCCITRHEWYWFGVLTSQEKRRPIFHEEIEVLMQN